MKLYIRQRLGLKKDGVTADLVQIISRHIGLRHAGKRGELVNHAPYIIHLADNGIGAGLEGFNLLADLAAIFSPQPFCG